MLDNKGFDLWADGYDRAVGLSEEANSYPFAGYKEVLGDIFQEVVSKEDSKAHQTEIYLLIPFSLKVFLRALSTNTIEPNIATSCMPSTISVIYPIAFSLECEKV
ncbi:hypothetical protein SAMN02910384_02729 [Pseudobutyrivibrio sp. ACV-2]|uniref:hypothetical protein n=1 Tax=Pseudobutyrivibrio sp. ACV-2 TaxID=1520801 RepID=UPI000895906C|nr:hypothetical protein [Pseudobutyrivibrio sp. ACV-2]SEA92275.1 hypothetical protein SAMN02910384_02729 [Pseudobutyrivibrio sp. ACV-2]